jgi:hypothetical protein
MEMEKRIIYRTPEGKVAVISPSPFSPLSVEQVAAKDVPTGLSYKIVDAADIPSGRKWRDTWTVAVEDLIDGVGA